VFYNEVHCVFIGFTQDQQSIGSLCECEDNNPDSLDARLFPSVVLASRLLWTWTKHLLCRSLVGRSAAEFTLAMIIYICSADGSTHTESNKLYRKVKHRYRPNLSPRQRPTAKSRHDQAALAASAEARGATHRARPRSPSRFRCLLMYLYLYIT